MKFVEWLAAGSRDFLRGTQSSRSLRHLLPYWLSAVDRRHTWDKPAIRMAIWPRFLAMESECSRGVGAGFAGRLFVANAIALFGVLPQTIFLEVQA